jgi:hypothetical protein
MSSAWRKSSREFRGSWLLPPPPPSSTPCKSLCRLLPPPVGRNARQDSSNTNNTLNNNSRNSLVRRTTAPAAAAVVVAVALPTPLLPRVYGRPTSTLGPALFKCYRVPGPGGGGGGGRRLVASPVSAGYAGQCPSLRYSTVGQAALHATTRASAHPPWSVTGLQCLRL